MPKVMLENNFYCFSLTLPSSGHFLKTHDVVKTNPHNGERSDLMWTINDDEKKKFFFLSSE